MDGQTLHYGSGIHKQRNGQLSKEHFIIGLNDYGMI